MQVVEFKPEDKEYKHWTEEEDKLLVQYRLENKTPVEIGVLLNRSEFVINLRIHLLIHRLHRYGYTAAQIRLMMNAELSHILDITKPVLERNPIRRKENVWWDHLVTIWNNIWNSF